MSKPSSPSPGRARMVMRVVDGEGQGSVVETHATPLVTGPDGLPRTAVVEATSAHSDRCHFPKALLIAPVVRSLIGTAVTRLWRDDLVYAERLLGAQILIKGRTHLKAILKTTISVRAVSGGGEKFGVPRYCHA